MFKTTPYAHQLKALVTSRDSEAFALRMEQGTGKTKVIIDTAAHLYRSARINLLMVLAPKGVHVNWVTREVPKHLPDDVPVDAAYYSSGMSTKKKAAWLRLTKSIGYNRLTIVTFNFELLSVNSAFAEMQALCKSHDVLLVIDESHRIKDPGGVRTANALKLRKYANFRRTLTGTQVANGPLDVWSQYAFLDPNIIGHRSFVTFRNRYAKLLDQDHPIIKAIKARTGKAYGPTLIATDSAGRPMYQNVDELKRLVAPYTFSVQKIDCLDLPPKVYKRRLLEITATQSTHYQALVQRIKQGVASTDEFSASVSRMNSVGYLQRIVLGVLPPPLTADGQARALFGDPLLNPRIQALIEEIDSSTAPTIVWANYTYDIKNISMVLADRYGASSVVTYFGETTAQEREVAVNRFQSGDARFFVSNPAAGGTGLTLTAATEVHYYSNSFKLLERLQSEDRAHRIGQDKTVLYVDYESDAPIDAKIIQALADKRDLANEITGDKFIQWIA